MPVSHANTGPDPAINPRRMEECFSALMPPSRRAAAAPTAEPGHADLCAALFHKRRAASLSILPQEIGLTVIGDGAFVRVDRRSSMAVIPPGGLGRSLTPLLLEEGELGRSVRVIAWDPAVKPMDLSTAEIEHFQQKHRLRLGMEICAPRIHGLDARRYYQEVVRGSLWPLCHGFSDKVKPLGPNDWQLLQSVCQSFAKRAAEQWDGKSVVWIHNYPLMLTPQYLRELLPEAAIVYTHHAAFPEEKDLIGRLPLRDLIRGMLGSDSITFQSKRDCANFCGVCRYLGLFVQERSSDPTGTQAVRVGSRVVKLFVSPLGVDPAHIRSELEHPLARSEESRIRELYPSQFVFVASERMDYTKGIAERLAAIPLLLDQHPDLYGRFVLIQNATPTDDESAKYREYSDNVLQLVHKINTKYGSSCWRPVEHSERTYPHPVVLGQLRAADCVIATPTRDGINLLMQEAIVAAEYEDPERPPVFILGKGAGIAERLGMLSPIDSNNPQTIADAMHEAFCSRTSPEIMSVARQRFMDALGYLMQNDLRSWYENHLRLLNSAYRGRSGNAVKHAEPPSYWTSVERTTSREATTDLRLERAQLLAEQLAAAAPMRWVIDIDRQLAPLIHGVSTYPDRTFLSDPLRNLARLAAGDELILLSHGTQGDLMSHTSHFEGYPVVMCCSGGLECFDFRRGVQLCRVSEEQKKAAKEMKRALCEFLGERAIPGGLIAEENQCGVALRYGGALIGDASNVARRLITDFFDEARLPSDEYQIRHRGSRWEVIPAACTTDSVLDLLCRRRTSSDQGLSTALIGDSSLETPLLRWIQQIDGRLISIGSVELKVKAHDQLDDLTSLQLALGLYIQRRLGLSAHESR